VQWSRRGYDVLALEHVYTGDQARVSLVVQAIRDTVANPLAMRALGFCVSVRHARFMTHEFSRRGLHSVAVSADTPTDDREAALRDLRDGTVKVVFCVDLFNEGVDVPEIDTVLFLRPTESAVHQAYPAPAAAADASAKRTARTHRRHTPGQNRNLSCSRKWRTSAKSCWA
jgi:superfamily II DNA/RNA helicase